jgi:hypothetical protein
MAPYYEPQFELACDAGLDYVPRQLFSSLSYLLNTIFRRVYEKLTKLVMMANIHKVTKTASRNDPHPTVSCSEGLIHINLRSEVLPGLENGISVFKGTYYGQVELVQATELNLVVSIEKLTALETKIELLNLKVQVAVADSGRWKRRFQEMLDCRYASIDSSRNTSRKSVKIAATPAKRSAATKTSTAPKKDSGDWLLPLR